MFTHRHSSMEPHSHASVAEARHCSSAFEDALHEYQAAALHADFLRDNALPNYLARVPVLAWLDAPNQEAEDRALAEMQEAERERQSEWAYRAPTLADAHADWHAQNGRFAVCPLDCGAGEGGMDEWDVA